MGRISPVMMGAVTALLAVTAQAYLYLYPPPAYGICIVCHGRDLIVWAYSFIMGLKPKVAAASVYWPLLTVVGVFLGSRYAAKEHGEYQPRFVEPPLISFFCGMGVMILGLIIMGCPARLLLRTAYGDTIAFAGVIALVAGVAGATLYMRWRTK